MKFNTSLRRKTQIHTCTEKSLNETIEKMLKNNTYAMIKFNTLKNPQDIYISLYVCIEKFQKLTNMCCPQEEAGIGVVFKEVFIYDV